MICPYCEYGYIKKALIIENGLLIKICEECDTVWVNDVNDTSGTASEKFFRDHGLTYSPDNVDFDVE